MEAEKHLYRLIVKEHHLDTYGHVNNATVLQLLEEARWEMITAKGYGMQTISETQQGPVILEITVKYRKELLLRQEVSIETSCVDYQRRIGHLKQRIYNPAGDIAVEALIAIGLFDLKRRKLLEPSPAWLHALRSSP